MTELQWFLTEQVEEEKTAREIVSKFRLGQGRSGGDSRHGPRTRVARARATGQPPRPR
jgi:hypothetical protein